MSNLTNDTDIEKQTSICKDIKVWDPWAISSQASSRSWMKAGCSAKPCPHHCHSCCAVARKSQALALLPGCCHARGQGQDMVWSLWWALCWFTLRFTPLMHFLFSQAAERQPGLEEQARASPAPSAALSSTTQPAAQTLQKCILISLSSPPTALANRLFQKLIPKGRWIQFTCARLGRNCRVRGEPALQYSSTKCGNCHNISKTEMRKCGWKMLSHLSRPHEMHVIPLSPKPPLLWSA